jgi:hypothetical protein
VTSGAGLDAVVFGSKCSEPVPGWTKSGGVALTPVSSCIDDWRDRAFALLRKIMIAKIRVSARTAPIAMPAGAELDSSGKYCARAMSSGAKQETVTNGIDLAIMR